MQYQIKGEKINSDYDDDYSYKHTHISGKQDKSYYSDSNKLSASGSKVQNEESRPVKGVNSSTFKLNRKKNISGEGLGFRFSVTPLINPIIPANGFKQLKASANNRSNEMLLHGRDRRTSLGMDSCDYNSNSSDYFEEHADYEN